MNSYFELRAAQAVSQERIQKHREPISLGRPKKARFHTTDSSSPNTQSGILTLVSHVARAAAGLL